MGATTQYVRFFFFIIGTYSTISFFNAFLQLLFPVRFGINQLLSQRCIHRQDYVRDVLPTLKYVIWHRCNLWVLQCWFTNFSTLGYSTTSVLLFFFVVFLRISAMFRGSLYSTDHSYLVVLTDDCGFFINLAV